jgi:hypothetical protein
MLSRALALGAFLALSCHVGPAAADDWKANAARMDAEAKAFDQRQYFRMEDACTAEFSYVSPNRKDRNTMRVDLKLVDGESIENGADNYTVPFNFSRVGFDCHRGAGRPNCTNGRYTFGHVPVKPGSEPAFCKMFIQAVATCQGVASFKPSKRGCQLLDWEKDFIKNGPPKKERIPSPF